MSVKKYTAIGLNRHERGFAVVIRCNFNEDDDAIWTTKTKVLIIDPEPPASVRAEIEEMLTEHGPWLEDYVWSRKGI